MAYGWILRAGYAALAVMFFAAFPVAAGAAPARTADFDNPDAREPATPPMWRVSDADSEIYLLGTFHILPQNFEWRSSAVETALDAADTIWFEAEVDTAEARQKTLHILMTEGFDAAGKTLSDRLDPADATRLETIVNSLGLSMKAIEPMRPWQAFLTLSVQFIVSQGFDPNSGVETALLKEARMRGLETRFFETVEEQLGLFTNLDPEAEKHLLTITLREWDEQAADFDDLFAAWTKGDVAAIDAMMNESLRDAAPEVYEVLVTGRNAAWAKEIAAEMAGAGTALIAVGAGHLVGENSVPALLRTRGFQVERFDPNGVASDNPSKPADEFMGERPPDAPNAETQGEE